ncbi:MAG: hypothetical protein IPI67_22395 [Myxococcales bacterium]|nr:hypothetical protein [Myxococcales bacterium]
MKRVAARWLWLPFFLAAGSAAPEARADKAPPAWPVRANVSMPFGSTGGREQLQGFTWGFRGSVSVYPTDSGRGVGVGVYIDTLIDAQTHSLSSWGGAFAVPFASADWIDFRVGAYAGSRGSSEGGDNQRRLAAGVFTDVVLPAYLYDLRGGLRLDSSFDGRGMSSRSLLFEVDIAALLGLFALAGSGVR